MNRFFFSKENRVGLMISKENVDNAILMRFSIEQVFIFVNGWWMLLSSCVV
jgi:hypothetical protein